MDELHLTRAGLESMTSAELVRVADSFGIDIPPGLDRVFVIEELLDIVSLYESFREEPVSPEIPKAESPPSCRDGGEAGGARAEAVPETLSRGGDGFSSLILFPTEDPEGPLQGTPAVDVREGVFGTEDFPGSVPFPKQYNITFIDVMIRDPLWAFAFWEIKEHDRETFERMAGFDGYRLRINPLGEGGTADLLSGFTVSISPEDTAWYIGFPSENTGGRFQVELCARLWERIDVLASSRVFAMPKLQERAGLSGQRFSALALLSGAEEFPILRNPERKVRLRYGQEHRPGK
ncbi:MAG: DUF4912 domain-containing protein [Treponema sp.]|jgi:hypothetical protein|nr:DUF4912 domain-containing protein [Treponema sp.]